VKAAVLNKFGQYKVEYREDGRFKRFQINEPTLGLLESLSTSYGEIGPLPNYAIHTSTVGTVKFLLQLLTGFLATHTYSAFQEEEDNDLLAKDHDEDFGSGPVPSFLKDDLLDLVEAEDALPTGWQEQIRDAIKDVI